MTPWEERWLSRGLSPRWTHSFFYHNSAGAAVVRKQRFALMSIADGSWTGDKTYLVSHRSVPSVVLGVETWEPGVGDRGAGLMYGLPRVENALLRGSEIWWTEGERDADSLIEAGEVATTHYQGSAGARDDQVKVLVGASRVNIVMDNDDVGVQIAWYHARLLRRVGYVGEILVWRPPTGCKDVALLLANGGVVGDLIRVGKKSLASLSEQLGPLPRGGSDGGWGYSAEAIELGNMIERNGWKVRVRRNGKS